ncbi:hypothetical protein [Salinimicrobium sp. HB62]|uniref:hypothetical protein n=1 Tax=Salinimicrobium sp. HB62 TaxID=3077781 RepID=UPI002D780E26|nr:hypothetical protein [Salinimicrobium sp. HB62]
MKKMFLGLMILMWAGIANAQFTELKEARVGFDPNLPEVTVEGDTYVFRINKRFGEEFEKDPIGFLNKHCRLEAFIDLVEDEGINGYQVDVKSTKGRLKASYCKEGNLRKVSYKLKNVLLPPQLQEEVYRKYRGWNMTRNVHRAKGRDGIVEEEYFKIRLEKEGEVQNLRIDMEAAEIIELAGL